LLRVANLRKTYDSAHQPYVALDGIDVEINDGEFFCLLGPSGCGKSTLLNILAGFEPATSGSVTFKGSAVTGAGRDRVMFFQDAGSALFPWLSVEENVRFGLRVRKVPKGEWESVIQTYLRMVDLDRHRSKFPWQLSGGMRQRIANRAGARGRAGSPADGRAVRRARRPHAPQDAFGAAYNLAAHRQDGGVRHP
jgi:NitT/TauT family transport system ATP-binding protein